MATLAELRELVRQQTETTTAELPDITIDNYLTQGYQRTLNAEIAWPFYENSWAKTVTAGDWGFALPDDLDPNGIMSVVDVASGLRLRMIDHEEAEDRFWRYQNQSPAQVLNFSVWGRWVYTWPRYEADVDVEYQLRGFRLPNPFPTSPEAEPDMDSRLQLGLAHYATALAYAQQEDMELEDQYMKRWNNDVEMARQNIMKPAQHRPAVMGPHWAYVTPIGPGFRTRGGPTSWTFRNP